MKFNDVCGAVDAGRPVSVPESFSVAVISAAETARKGGEIGWFSLWRIRAAVRSPRKLAKIYGGVCDEAIAAGIASGTEDADGFDWENILAFIERLLPLILQLISLFG